jgi:hypothetical protein
MHRPTSRVDRFAFRRTLRPGTVVDFYLPTGWTPARITAVRKGTRGPYAYYTFEVHGPGHLRPSEHEVRLLDEDDDASISGQLAPAGLWLCCAAHRMEHRDVN